MKKLILLLFMPLLTTGQNNSLVSSEIKYYEKDFLDLKEP
jgi:hypothetical protein